MSSTSSRRKGRGSRLLAGLDEESILTASAPGTMPSDIPKFHSLGTRQSISGVQKTPLYDQKSHPMDKEIDQRRWNAHLRREGLPTSTKGSEDLVSLYSEGYDDEDPSSSLELTDGEDSDHSDGQPRRRRIIQDDPQIGHAIDPRASRRSDRLQKQNILRPHYNLKKHPNDDSIPGFRRRPAQTMPASKRQKTQEPDEVSRGSFSLFYLEADTAAKSEASSPGGEEERLGEPDVEPITWQGEEWLTEESFEKILDCESEAEETAEGGDLHKPVSTEDGSRRMADEIRSDGSSENWQDWALAW